MVRSRATSVGPRSGEPGISWPRASRPASNLDRCAGRRPQDARSCSTSRLERVEPLGQHLHLDPAQLHRPLAVADHDDRVVERDLGRVDAADAQGEGPPPRADLEHLVQPPRADDGAQPSPHRSVGPEGGQPEAGRTSVTSSRWRRPLLSAGRVSFSVTSSWRPRRRVRTTKPARAMRQSSVSR